MVLSEALLIVSFKEYFGSPSIVIFSFKVISCLKLSIKGDTKLELDPLKIPTQSLDIPREKNGTENIHLFLFISLAVIFNTSI